VPHPLTTSFAGADWAETLAMELNQADTSAEAHTLLCRIHKISSFVVEGEDGGTEISNCPGFVRCTMSSKVERSSERSEERACVLLRFKAGAAIIGAIRRFGSPEVQYEALNALETLVNSGDREILSPAFSNYTEAQSMRDSDRNDQPSLEPTG
jgi:hypothetical protein